ncbi:MAG TPA: sialate O-acetylesterase [Verrucomicrobiae bacterium]|nr:sialate O-acetylesterase [Verrucomicrobiae bacterium]
MNARFAFSISLLSLVLGVFAAEAEVTPNPLFADNAVLQQGMKVPIWGTADPGERVRVEFAKQNVATTADSAGKWLVHLAPMKAGGPYTLTISGKNKIVCTNVLVGEVWICSGQSNMERQLGLRAGQKPITDWEKEVRDAKYPEIRQFYVPQVKAFAPVQTVQGSWAVCSPETVTNFTAVGYFFGRDLYQARHVPIGLIHSSWGGTVAEAWTSEAALSRLPDFADALAQLKRLVANPAEARRETQAIQDAWYAKVDTGSKDRPPWSASELDTSSWKTMKLPTNWENAGYPNFDGIFWFRRKFDLPPNWDGSDVELHLGAVDDNDTTWVNGTEVGATIGWNVPRIYRVPGSSLKPTNNVIAVRVLDTGAGGGLWGGDDPMRMIVTAGGQTNSIPLTGPWLCRPSVSLMKVGWPPTDLSQSPNAPTVLYNGMIAPLVPYAMRGVIWYQGESNVGRERQYRTLFPTLIADWRQAWGEGDFPFLFVQIAPYNGMTPEIREAQLLTMQHTTNTAMAVTIDCGDANDIHPAHKQPVGARLALAARALAYGEKTEYSGPVFESMTVKGSEAILRFTHIGGGLVAKGGPLRGFTVAGADGIFHPAQAKIRGKSIAVRSAAVSKPTAVRYGWADVPDGNLFNRAGLPASPFRSDVD